MVSYKKGEVVKLSENFNSTEFDCKGSGCCSITTINPQLVNYLQLIRNHFGKPITITSGYRCYTHNKRVGGATGSRHNKGDAADIVVSGVAPREVAKFAESIGIKGIGLYETAVDGYFVHIDTRTTKSFWYGQKQEKRTTFDGATTNKDLVVEEQKEEPGTKNAVMSWQLSAIADGFSFPSGADGLWGAECVSVAGKAVIKKRANFLYKNLTKIVQRAVGATVDGLCGDETKTAIKKYQKQKGLKQDGEVGLNTWKMILA